MQEDENYFILFGGDVEGTYDGANYEARWNRRFYSLSDDVDLLETVFVMDDQGDSGSRSIPVLYFASGSPVDIAGALEPGTNWDDAEALGGTYGFLTLSLEPATGEPLDNLVLFIEQEVGSDEFVAIQERPKDAMGSIAPIVWVEGEMNGDPYPEDAFIGGLNGTVFEWNYETDLFLTAISDRDFGAFFGVENTVIDMYAFDFDTVDEEGDELVDFYWFPLGTGLETGAPSNGRFQGPKSPSGGTIFESSMFGNPGLASSATRHVPVPVAVGLVGVLALLSGMLRH